MPAAPEAVRTSSAPKPLPQFSQAIKYNGMVYCSGNIGLIPGDTFQLAEGTVKDRAVSHPSSVLDSHVVELLPSTTCLVLLANLFNPIETNSKEHFGCP